MYWTVIIPWVPPPFRTKWHPRDEEKGGPFDPLTRGAFKTEGEAIAWAREHLYGAPYSLKTYASVNDELAEPVGHRSDVQP